MQATSEMALDPEAIQTFAATVRGRVLVAGDPGYDDARTIWNGLIDRQPALVVQPTGAADVVDAVNLRVSTICFCRSRVAGTTSLVTRSTTMGW